MMDEGNDWNLDARKRGFGGRFGGNFETLKRQTIGGSQIQSCKKKVNQVNPEFQKKKVNT